VAGDVANKVVDGTNYTTYSATWTAVTTVPNITSSNAKIRVTANDNEAANNTGVATSGTYSLDTTPPTIDTFNFDSSNVAQDVINLTTTDTSALQYRLCNAADFLAPECAWTSITSASPTVINWTLVSDANGNDTVYLEVRDAVGNTTTRTGVGPAMPGSFSFKDVSNTNIGCTQSS